MHIPAISSATPAANRPEPAALPQEPGKLAEASRQFESIMLRQFLGESMKGLLNSGPSSQVYGYLLTDTLADSLSKGGGLGLASVIQAQLGKGQR
jgi:flagellar protein FlgJ